MNVLAALSAAAVADDKVTPGLLGFLVVLAIGLATWLLLRSMTRQLKKVDFEDGSEPGSVDQTGESPTVPPTPDPAESERERP